MRAGRALGLVALAAVLANSSWFSVTAVVPALQRQWQLSPAEAAWLVIVVQIGFVVGSVGAGLLNLPDRVQPWLLIAGSAISAGVASGGLLLAGGLAAALPLRFLVGVALAGCMPRASGWSRRTFLAGGVDWRAGPKTLERQMASI